MDNISGIAKHILLVLTGVLIASTIFYLFTFSTYEEKEDQSHQKQFEQHYQIYALNIPKKMSFAGEEVPLHLIDVHEKLDRELLVNTYWQSNSLLFYKRTHRWFPVIEPILKQHNIPDDFKYLALIESGLTNVVSPAGATGFWQIMKATGREGGLEINSEVDERYHLEKATQLACDYLKEAKEKFGSWTLAAASYNMGMNGLKRQLEKQKVNNYYDLLLNDETSRYLFRIFAVKHIQENPKDFGFNFRPKDLYPNIETFEIPLDSAVSDFTLWAAQQNINYKVLKYFNPWLRQRYLKNTKKKSYNIKIPKDHFRQQIMLEVPQLAVQDSTSGE